VKMRYLVSIALDGQRRLAAHMASPKADRPTLQNIYRKHVAIRNDARGAHGIAQKTDVSPSIKPCKTVCCGPSCEFRRPSGGLGNLIRGRLIGMDSLRAQGTFCLRSEISKPHRSNAGGRSDGSCQKEKQCWNATLRKRLWNTLGALGPPSHVFQTDAPIPLKPSRHSLSHIGGNTTAKANQTLKLTGTGRLHSLCQ
jgi:hypothetical protein